MATLSLGLSLRQMRPAFPGWIMPVGGIRPILYADFVAQNYFWNGSTYPTAEALITAAGGSVTRATTGYRIGPTGLLESVAANALRFDHDPTTLARLGVRTDPPRTNLLWPSEDLSAAQWAKIGLTLGSAITAPDGTTSAFPLVEDSATTSKSAQNSLISITTGQVYCFGGFVKAGSGSRWIYPNIGGSVFFGFNPSTGAYSSGAGLSAGVTTLPALQLPGGWWFCSARWTGTFTASTSFRIYLHNSGTSDPTNTRLGDGVSSAAFWGGMLVAHPVVGSYIKTVSGTVTSNAEVIYLADGLALPAAAGSLFVEFDFAEMQPATPGNNQGVAGLSDGTANNYIWLVRNAGINRWRNFSAGGGAANGDTLVTNSEPSAPNTVYKAMQGWSTNNFKGTLNGIAPVKDLTSTAPASLTKLRIGMYGEGVGADQVGRVRRVALYNFNPADADMQAVTA